MNLSRCILGELRAHVWVDLFWRALPTVEPGAYAQLDGGFEIAVADCVREGPGVSGHFWSGGERFRCSGADEDERADEIGACNRQLERDPAAK
jgi:hypothetical protein